ncbi:MAG: hypothetical protein AABX05_02470 [Nanoarchaeota archaeon]
MELTKQEKSVLKVLVEKELTHIKKDGQGFLITNAPFINKMAETETDFLFLKSLKLYKEFLENLQKKL